MKERTSKRALSWLLTMAMVFTMLPMSALAAGSVPTDPTEDPGPQSTALTVSAFAALAEDAYEIENGGEGPALPDTVNATVDGEEAQVAVTWTCGEFDAGTAGEYTFTAGAEGYTLAEGAAWPTVTVTVREPASDPETDPEPQQETTPAAAAPMALDLPATFAAGDDIYENGAKREMLTNGNFKTTDVSGLSGWQGIDSAGTALTKVEINAYTSYVSAAAPQPGGMEASGNALELNGVSGKYPETIYQKVSVLPGSTVDISFYYSKRTTDSQRSVDQTMRLSVFPTAVTGSGSTTAVTGALTVANFTDNAVVPTITGGATVASDTKIITAAATWSLVSASYTVPSDVYEICVGFQGVTPAGTESAQGMGNILAYASVRTPLLPEAYVASPSGTHRGSDTTGGGTALAPFATIGKAYEWVQAGGEIKVMDDLTMTASATFDKDKAVTILSDDADAATTDDAFTLKRGSTLIEAPLFAVTKGTVNLNKLNMDGGAVYKSTENTAAGMGAADNLDTANGVAAVKAPLVTVASGATLNVTGSTLEKNSYTESVSYGGAIYNEGGAVTLTGSTIRLCRVGHQGSAIYSKGGTVTLTDSTLSNNACTIQVGTLLLVNGAEAEMTGGAISNNWVKDRTPGVVMSGASKFTLSSGVISGNVTNPDSANAQGGGVNINSADSTFEMTGGTIENNTAMLGGGVYTLGTFNMTGGTITNNTATTTRSGEVPKGGGIYVAGGTANIAKGTISENHGSLVADQYSGGGITAVRGTVNIGDGTPAADGKPDVLIQGNKAYDGAGVMVGYGTTNASEVNVTIKKDVEISGNTGTFGSGVYVVGKSDTLTTPIATLDGAVVTRNTNTTGGAVMILGGLLNLKGATQITGNTNTADPAAACNLRLNTSAGPYATLSGALTTGANIGVSTSSGVEHVVGKTIATGSAADVASSAQYFHDDVTGSGSLSFQPGSPTTNLVFGAPQEPNTYVKASYSGSDSNGSSDKPYKTIAEAYAAVANGGTIHVMEPLSLTAGVTFDKEKSVTILSDDASEATESDAFAIERDSTFTNAPMFTVTKGTVKLQNITLDGKSDLTQAATTNLQAGGIYVNGGAVVLDGGAVVTGFLNGKTSSGYYAGGVKMDKGALTIQGTAKVTGNKGYDGAGVMVRGGAFTMTGGEISNNESTGYGGGLYISANNLSDTVIQADISGGKITGNYVSSDNGGAGIMLHNNSHLTLSGNVQITGNATAQADSSGRNNAAGVWLYGTTNTVLTVSDSVQIKDNKVAVTDWDRTTGAFTGGTDKDLVLADGQTVTVGASHLGDGARIGVYTATKPAAGVDVQIATAANADDLAHFFSNNAAGAGVIWCNGQSDADHSDTPLTTGGHTPTADTLWLSVDARQVADIAAGVDANGKLTLTAQGLDPNKVYTILDKDGMAHSVTLTTGTAGANDWFKPTADGTLAFTGLDPANAPYQLVSAADDATAPNGTGDGSSNALVGGKIQAYYVAGAAGGTGEKAWAEGDDDTGEGTRAKPYKTLTKAYGKLDRDGASTGIITVLSSIEQGNTLTFKPTTGAVVLGEPRSPSATIQRPADASDNSNYGLFDVNGSSVTFSDLILDGGWNGDANKGTNGAISVRGQGELTLKTCQVKSFSVNGNANANWDKCVINAGGGKLTLDWALVYGNENMRAGWPILQGGNITMKNGSMIVDNKTTTSYAVNDFTTLTLAGKVTISGNTNSSGAANLYLPDGKTVSANGLAAGSQIGVKAQTAPTAGNDVPVTGDTALTKYFFSDEPAKYGVKLGADNKVYLGVDAKLTVTDGGNGSIVVRPADKDKDYWAVDGSGNKVGPGVYDPATGAVTIKPLSPDASYAVVSVPKDTAQGDVSGDGGMGILTPPAKPATAPKKDGSYATAPDGAAGESKREPNANDTDKITIKGEADYSYAVRVKNDDGTYSYYDGTNKTGNASPTWKEKDSSGNVVFDNLPFGQDYEIVKVKTDNKGNPAAVPAVTEVPALPPTVGEGDLTTDIQDNGKATITVDPTDSDYNYILVGSDGKTVEAVKPGTGGSVKFEDLTPGADYQVLTQKKDADPAIKVGDDLTGKLDRATGVTTPAADKDSVTAKIENGTVTITVDPADQDSKYAVVNGSGDVVGGASGWKAPTDGKVEFTGLTEDTNYSVIVLPKDAGTFPTTGQGSAPGAVQVHTPKEDITLPADSAVSTTSNSITVNPTTAGLEYNLMDKDGNIVKGTWTPGDGGSITFDGLSSSSQYTVLVRNPNSGDPSVPVKGPAATTQGGGGSSGGGGGGSSASTSVKADKTENGKVKIDKPGASKGQTVTVTVTPDPGYELGKLVITDKKGNEVEVKDLGNGKYSFVMPADKPIKVAATFVETGATGDPETNGVSKLLIVDDHIAYMKGDDVGSFRPNGSITRAETAQMFYNLLKDKDVSGSKSFTDVAADAWYAKAVLALANLGVVEGVGEGEFQPDRAISRAEFVTVAMRFATNVTGKKTFSDVTEDNWAHGYITGAAYYGWINGYEDGTFKPANPISRAEAAAVVNNMLNREGDKSYIDKADGLTLFPDVDKNYWAFYEIMEATNAHDFTRDKDGVENWK